MSNEDYTNLATFFMEYKNNLAKTQGNKVLLSNDEMYKYTIIWEKTTPTGFLNAKRMPLRSHEDILVFYNIYFYIYKVF